MAKTILRTSIITVNGVDLSAHASQVEIDQKNEEVDVTGFGATSKETRLGLGDASISVTFFQDQAAGSVGPTLAPLVGSNTPFVVTVKGETGSKSATNPEYKMEAILPEYKPLSGNVGAASTIQVNFKNFGAQGIETLTS